MRRVADLVVSQLESLGLDTVFLVTGGGAMHLNDAFGRNKKFRIVFNHHEQACSMAAESYARLGRKPAVVNVTTGPGGINALNGVFGAFTDSIPMVVVSGQVKRETLARNVSPSLRQLGDQEVDIVSMVRPVVKYATVLQDPNLVLSVVQKAYHLATSGRPGPVWIDIPVDVQSTLVDEATLVGWDHKEWSLRGDPDLHPACLGEIPPPAPGRLKTQVATILGRLKTSRRPVLFVGTGVRISHNEHRFLRLADTLGIPVVTGFNAHDLVPTDHPCYAGRPGTIGDRAGNFTVQNADFVLILGTRLNIRQISYNWQSFAQRAWKAHVDIDASELEKPTLRTDLRVHADLGDFLTEMEAGTLGWSIPEDHLAYTRWCRERVLRYPVVLESYRKSTTVNPYYFMEVLFQKMTKGEIVVAANATACIVSFQTAVIHEGTRLFSNSGSASMGYDLPAAIGAAVAAPGRQVICLSGDGSFMMNMQELETIVGNQLPVKIFLLNNSGYHSIRQTQKAYFSDNLVGLDPPTGVTFPNFTAVAAAFGLKTWKVTKPGELGLIQEVLDEPGPCLCEVILDPSQDFSPKLTSRRLPDGTMLSPALEDMAPFLDRDELLANTLKD